MFPSILFLIPQSCRTSPPDCFEDLNLDQILDPILENEKRVPLGPYFYTPLSDLSQVRYRQEIFRDLLDRKAMETFDRFSREICTLAEAQDRAREDLDSGDPWRCHYLLFGHILDYSERYVRCIRALLSEAQALDLHAAGLHQGINALEALCESPFFTALETRQRELRQRFQKEQYCMLIKYGTVRVKKYEGEENLSEKILSVFQKFRQEDSPDYRQKFQEAPYADHVEAGILQCLSRIYPELFRDLSDYAREFCRFTDPGVLQLARELKFYLGWLRQTAYPREDGLPFCFPDFGEDRFFCNDFYDLALGLKIGNRVVKNDFYLNPGEQILVVTGPNQGGKTTFARALGQLHYLASLGLPIPGTGACLRLTDRVLTHFEKEESGCNGRLRDDLERLRRLLDLATGRSLVIINEIFASTAAQDAVALGKHMLEMLREKGSLTVLVTFLSELARSGPDTVSMMSTVDPLDPAVRTFRVVRKPPDDLTYAMTLATRHRLTYEQLIRRIPECK